MSSDIDMNPGSLSKVLRCSRIVNVIISAVSSFILLANCIFKTDRKNFANKLSMNEGKLNQVYSNTLMSPRVPGLW